MNAAGTRWRYSDPIGALGGITKIVVHDKSTVMPGSMRWVVKGKGTGSLALPHVSGVRAALVVGAACASHTWNGQAGFPPRCEGDASRLTCR